MKEPIKSMYDPSQLKEGDKVFIGDRTIRKWEKDICPLCYIPTEAEIASGDIETFEETQLCDAHHVDDLIREIGSKKSLRIEQWRDEYKHWRAGIEWYGKDAYEFIVEQPTLRECLIAIKNYLK